MQRPRRYGSVLALATGMLVAAAVPAPVAAEVVFSAYSGTSRTLSSDLRLRQPSAGTDLTVHDMHWNADPFKPAPYYGLRVTRFDPQRPAWGTALDYTHYKVYADTGRQGAVAGTWRGAPIAATTAISDYVQRFELSHGVNVLSLNVIHRWLGLPLASGRVQPYAGAGLASYWPHAESIVGNDPHEAGYHFSRFGLQLLAGVHYALTEHSGVFLETKFDRGKARVGIAGGEAETRLRTFHLIAGVSYRF